MSHHIPLILGVAGFVALLALAGWLRRRSYRRDTWRDMADYHEEQAAMGAVPWSPYPHTRETGRTRALNELRARRYRERAGWWR